jgi:cell division septation protein DedD
MKNETDGSDLIVVGNDSGLTRWAPLVVVLSVVGGFVMLSWYAYHAGIQSVKEEDLVVVEADKTPMKEKPSDPGGMQFPNQDKTVFETFSGNNGKQPPAKVERVLPVPEEPMPKDAAKEMAKEADATEPTTWVNKDLHKNSGKEQVIGKDLPKKITDKTRLPAVVTGPDEKPVYSSKDSADRQVIAAQDEPQEEQSVSYVAPKKPADMGKPEKVIQGADKHAKPFAPEKVATNTKEATKETPKEEKLAFAPEIAKVETKEEGPKEIATKEVPIEKPKPEKKPAQETHVSSGGGHSMVQLGAYRSEEEASETWDKMHLKHKDLSDKKPTIVRADLGAKGVFYRLRVGGLDSAADAKALCRALSAKGQACIIPTDK